MIDGCKADIYSLGLSMLSLMYPMAKSPKKLVIKLKENIKSKNFMFKDLLMLI